MENTLSKTNPELNDQGFRFVALNVDARIDERAMEHNINHDELPMLASARHGIGEESKKVDASTPRDLLKKRSEKTKSDASKKMAMSTHSGLSKMMAAKDQNNPRNRVLLKKVRVVLQNWVQLNTGKFDSLAQVTHGIGTSELQRVDMDVEVEVEARATNNDFHHLFKNMARRNRSNFVSFLITYYLNASYRKQFLEPLARLDLGREHPWLLSEWVQSIVRCFFDWTGRLAVMLIDLFDISRLG
ncbi:hypothetical protein V6N11_033888 [Hibiscus sabdariffa]|uniref:Uncharacterized protein n=1 Tax=Hibiscus sabdariffa TaxID=183260 RepID=A0ABR2S130_9ROSI